VAAGLASALVFYGGISMSEPDCDRCALNVPEESWLAPWTDSCLNPSEASWWYDVVNGSDQG
jgi:hypothetical protein